MDADEVAVVRVVPDTTKPETIAAGLRARESWAARALYARFGDRINALVWRLLGADQEHHDVVHQVFVNILASIGKLRDVTLFEPWVISVTVNTVRKELRNRGYRRLFTLRSEMPERACEMHPESTEFLRHFHAVIRRLGADERVVFVLHYVEEHTLAEIAATCGCSLRTAKRRLARARESFAKKAATDPVLKSAIEEVQDSA